MGRALITGASSGLGAEFAWILAAEGNNLVLVARNEKRLATIAEDIRQKANVDVEVLPADLALADGVERVAKRLKSEDSPVTLLINNAGMGLEQDFIDGSISRELGAANVMIDAIMLLSHAALSVMVKRGRGTIINVSSITALTAQGTYSAAKSWVKTFTEGLAADLVGTGVNVSVVLPGLMHTNFHRNINVDPRQWADWMFIDAYDVANAALAGARRKQVIVVPSLLYRIAYYALKFAPRTLVRRIAGPRLSGRKRN